MADLCCPFCDDTFSAILEYTPQAYSEHRDLTGYECDNYACCAEWSPSGQLRIPSKLTLPTNLPPRDPNKDEPDYKHLFADTLYWIIAKLDGDSDEGELTDRERMDAVTARCEHWIKEYDL